MEEKKGFIGVAKYKEQLERKSTNNERERNKERIIISYFHI